ncbi:hypothetical protein M422DRAFT_194345 [Sphaerobolus stellatus SS14]|uniref:Uncharacterized protein n=1 Tax=Sphaerobolus stellatus (strain SS14) TaxID=990650 RepID=A0A0C9UH04_SPHS4|nr:hypothetical protein M422DRAFT_194345 [Sphaerobolus stellatus SS14]
MYLFLVRRKAGGSTYTSRSPNPLILGSICIFVTITAHWCFTFKRLFQAFVTYKEGQASLEFYEDLTQTTEVVKTGFLVASLCLGDAMIIYRLWIVWGYNKRVIIFPICTLIGLTICGTGITYQFTRYTPGENVFLSIAGRWITSDCVFTLCTNVYSTVFIGYRIWKVNRASAKYAGGRSLDNVLGIIIESAAIYTSWTIFFFASYQSQSNLQFIVVDCWSSASGIAAMFINVRVGLGWATKAVPSIEASIGSQNGSGLNGRDAYHMRPLAANITHIVTEEGDGTYYNSLDGPGKDSESASTGKAA